MSHSADFAIAPLIAILSPYHNTLVPANVTSALLTFPGTHSVSTSAFSPPYDLYPRNITAWLSNNISIGGEQFNETVIGGPSSSSSSFNPAVIQWNTGSDIGYITVSKNDISSKPLLIEITVIRYRKGSHSHGWRGLSQPHLPVWQLIIHIHTARLPVQRKARCSLLG
jgi:hypothetical protein